LSDVTRPKKKRKFHTFLAGHTLSLLGLIWIAPFNVKAQEPPSRPKIGLALEGGGALGLAHIGVLEWFEEHHIPVDYIAGTSMGGLVGGIYATGLRASEVHKVVENLDWDSILRGQLPYRDLAYRRKEDLRDFQNYLNFGLKKGLGAPSGLNTGQEVTFLLDRLTLPYSGQSFDTLPIPFRCVATDLSTGKPHVFDSGPLGEALRSTMSLPAVFSPVIRDGRIYADGGLLNNLPVDVVKQMGADIVIAVYLDGSPFNPQAPQSLFSVMGRSIGVMIAANEVHNAEAADILITAALPEYTTMSFTQGEKIIHQGYLGADRKSALLARMSLDEQAWNQYLAVREARKPAPAPPPAFVTVTGVGEHLATDIQAKLSDQVGTTLDTSKLEHNLNLLAGTSRFSSFSYRLTQEHETSGLLVHADENAYAPPFLKLGIFIDGAEPDNVLFSAKARLTVMDAVGARSEWRTDLSVGSEWGVTSELYKFLGPTTNWFIAPRIRATNDPFQLFSRSTQVADYRIYHYGGGLDLGYAINRYSELRIGYDASYFKSTIRVGEPLLPTPSGALRSSSIRYNLDNLDSPVIPRSGEAVRGTVQWTDAAPGATRGFPLAELYVAGVRPISKPVSLFAQAYGGTTFGHENTGLPQFFLGGPGRLTAYGVNELRANQYFLVRLGYIRELAVLPPLIGGKVYLLSAYEVGKTYGTPPNAISTPSSRLPMDGTLAVVVDTLLGPLAIGGSAGDTGHYSWYFRLGRIF
jgi:NTE family protein